MKPKQITRQSDARLTACPHCEGENGYLYKRIVRHTQINNWDNTPVDCVMEGISGGIAVYCDDCGKRVDKYFDKYS